MSLASIKFSLIMAFIVTSYISFTLVFINIGFGGDFVFLLATPSLLIVAPLIRKKKEIPGIHKFAEFKSQILFFS